MTPSESRWDNAACKAKSETTCVQFPKPTWWMEKTSYPLPPHSDRDTSVPPPFPQN